MGDSFVPEDSPALIKGIEDEQGRFDLPYQGESKGDKQTIILSERAIQAPEDRKPRSSRIESYWKNLYNEYLLPGEPAEGPGSPKDNVAQWDIGKLLPHELEHTAELGALEHAGWESTAEALDIPEAERQAKIDSWERQRAAVQEMWAHQRGNGDDERFNAPLGPHFVTCHELDVTEILPLRPKYFRVSQGSSSQATRDQGRPLLIEINYRLKSGE